MKNEQATQAAESTQAEVFNPDLTYYNRLYLANKSLRAKDGLWEMILGLSLLTGAIRVAATVYDIKYIKLDTFFVFMLLVFCSTIYSHYHNKLLSKMSLNPNKKERGWGLSEMGWDEMVIIPLVLMLFLVDGILINLGVKLPKDTHTTLSVVSGLSAFAILCLMYVAKYYVMRYFIWAVIAILIAAGLGLQYITTANFYLYIVPFGLVMMVFGFLRHLRFIKGQK